MREHALMVGAVLHDRTREIGQITLPEERQRQLPQLLGQADALAGALVVHHVVGAVVLEVLREQHDDEHRDDGQQVRSELRQRLRWVGQVGHERARNREQHADGRHEHDVGQRRSPHATLEIARSLFGQCELVTQHGCRSFRSSTLPTCGNRPTSSHTGRRPQPARRAARARPPGPRPARI